MNTLSPQQAATHLLNHKVVAFATETVYGLGARADSNQAVQKIYDLKGRPSHNPLIAHVSTLDMAQTFAEFKDTALKLAHLFWPGPLTLVLPLTNPNKIAASARANLSTVAVRCPDHPLAQELLKIVNIPLVAPSANISNRISPTRAEHVKHYFPTVPILEGGQSQTGLESTIIDLTGKTPLLLRPGALTVEDIFSQTQIEVNVGTQSKIINAPGQLSLHYAPTVPLRMNVTKPRSDEIFIGFGSMACDHNLSPKGCLVEASHHLYHSLLMLEKQQKPIAICPIPNNGAGGAINDRLQRAASKTKSADS